MVPVSLPVITRSAYGAIHKRTRFTILETQMVNFETAVVLMMGISFH